MIIWFNHPNVKTLAETLPKKGIEIGCNFFYQIRNVDHICSYDYKTVDQITEDIKTPNSPKSPKWWTRSGFKTDLFDQVIAPLRIKPEDSGTLAVYLAIKYLNAKEITIIGCGWHTNDTRSLFDQQYSHRKGAAKVTNSKLKLLRNYQREFNVPIRFVCDQMIDKDFSSIRIEDLPTDIL